MVKTKKIVLRFSLSVFISFVILNFLFPLHIAINYSQSITADDGTVLHAFLTKDEKWRIYTSLDEISPKLRKAIIYKEDKWFYYHPGVNLIAVVRAAFNNIIKHRKTSGASTITMQVARMLTPADRTVGNKLIEMFRALQLELYYSKDEILQLYLNLVPYGGNIEGVKAASLLYFQTMPKHLSLAQITALSIIPNRPVSLRPGKNNSLLMQQRNKWLNRMATDQIFSKTEISDALNEPLDAKRLKAPRQIPHLALRLKSLYPDSAIIQTNINVFSQKKVETIAYNYSQRLQLRSIYNNAVIVIDNKTRRVVAYMGSNDFNDLMHAGQVDGVTAIRSPGSTLKPLAYAIAFDKGLLTPATVIADVPVNYLGYSPENFNSKFNGNVTVKSALANSLNIPAVKILNTLGVPTFTEKLSQAGFQQITRDRNKLGLSVILGGCGVSLEELANLFSTFASEGNYQHLKFLKNDTDSLKSLLISPSASFLTTEILTTLIRPDLPNNYESSMHIPQIAWKTGTSYGRRDAWSIGYNKNYTVGVWVGNFSGEGVVELSGADVATPLLFEIFNSLDYNSTASHFIPPKDLDFRLVCSESGKVPSDFCTHQVIDYYLPGISSNQKCTHLKEMFISADEKYSYCTSCVPDNGYKKKYYPNLEPDLISFYNNEHISYQKIPEHNPECVRVFSQHPPRITSPVNKKEYIVEKGQGDKLMLSCNADNEVTVVYWYIDDIFYASSKSGEQLFFTPKSGFHKISCADDKGRNSNIEIKVSEI